MSRTRYGLFALGLLACGEQGGTPPAAEDPGRGVAAAQAPAVEPVPAEIFLREPVAEPGPPRLLLHVLIPAAANEDQIRLALTEVLTRTAQEDTTLVALRAVAYVLPPVREGEVELVPSAWGEWLPPEGWEGATPDSRRSFHRIYTYLGVAPGW